MGTLPQDAAPQRKRRLVRPITVSVDSVELIQQFASGSSEQLRSVNCERLAIVLCQLLWVFDTTTHDPWMRCYYDDPKRPAASGAFILHRSFPWLDKRQIRTTIEALVKLGLLHKEPLVNSAGKPTPTKGFYICPSASCDHFREFVDDGENSDCDAGGHNGGPLRKPFAQSGADCDTALRNTPYSLKREELRDSNNSGADAPAAAATTDELSCLAEMREWRGFIFNHSKSLEYIRKLSIEFPTVDLTAVCKKLSAWLDDEPSQKGGHSRLRTFCENSVKYNRNLKHSDNDEGGTSARGPRIPIND